MKCEHCGALLPEEAKFCPVCGAKTALGVKAEEAAKSEPLEPEIIAANIASAVNIQNAEKEPEKEALPEVTEESAAEEKEEKPAEPVSVLPPVPEKEEKPLAEPAFIREAFTSLREELLNIAGSGAVFMTALLSLLFIAAQLVRDVYPILIGTAELDFGTLIGKAAGMIIALILAVALFALYNRAHKKEPAVSTEALGTVKVIAILMAVVVGFALVGMVIIATFFLVMRFSGVSLLSQMPALPFPEAAETVVVILFPAIILRLLFAFIYEIKLAILCKNASAIAKGRLARLKTGYLRFANGVEAVAMFLTALIFAAMITSGDFIVSFVRDLGYSVAEEVEAMTLRETPILFGIAAGVSFLGAARRFFTGRIYRRAARAMKAFDAACGKGRK